MNKFMNKDQPQVLVSAEMHASHKQKDLGGSNETE